MAVIDSRGLVDDGTSSLQVAGSLTAATHTVSTGDLILSGATGSPAGGNVVIATMTASLAITAQACSASATTPFGFFMAYYTSGSTTTRVAIPMFPFLAKPGS